MVKIRWTDFALDNLIAIGDYIEKDSYFYAQRVVDSLFNAVDILENNPLAGRKVPEFNNRNIRELIRGSYRIVYKIVSDNYSGKYRPTKAEKERTFPGKSSGNP